jgi:hypothetical protein
MRTTWLMAAALALAPAAHAQRGDSIMFQEQPPPFLNAPAADAGDECAQMARQLDELKGQPQRRYALVQRYRAECQAGQGADAVLPGQAPGEP